MTARTSDSLTYRFICMVLSCRLSTDTVLEVRIVAKLQLSSQRRKMLFDDVVNVHALIPLVVDGPIGQAVVDDPRGWDKIRPAYPVSGTTAIVSTRLVSAMRQTKGPP